MKGKNPAFRLPSHDQQPLRAAVAKHTHGPLVIGVVVGSNESFAPGTFEKGGFRMWIWVISRPFLTNFQVEMDLLQSVFFVYYGLEILKMLDGNIYIYIYMIDDKD